LVLEIGLDFGFDSRTKIETRLEISKTTWGNWPKTTSKGGF
jgi:hypothetical protein